MKSGWAAAAVKFGSVAQTLLKVESGCDLEGMLWVRKTASCLIPLGRVAEELKSPLVGISRITEAAQVSNLVVMSF